LLPIFSYTGGKFATGINDIGGKFATDVVENRQQIFHQGVVDTGGAP
jgi:hypothetical protein